MMDIDGTEIFVSRTTGNGPINFVLIHNAGGTHAFFSGQVDLLREYGHVWRIDLPGHGNSGTLLVPGISEYARVVAKVCNTYSLENILLIGLNLGANIAIEMAATHLGSRLTGMIVIDPPIFMDEGLIEEIVNLIDQLGSQEPAAIVEGLVTKLLENAPADIKDIAARAYLSANVEGLQQLYADLIAWDAAYSSKLGSLECRGLCILTDEHLCNRQKVQVRAPRFEIARIPEARSWAPLEKPERINTLIQKYLENRQIHD